MEEINLLVICLWAFIAVITLLSILSLAMRILIQLFPEKSDGSDPAMVAAIGSAAASATGGGRVTEIKELKR